MSDLREKAEHHAIDLEQCSLFVDRAPLAKSMTDAAKFLRELTAAPAPAGGPVAGGGDDPSDDEYRAWLGRNGLRDTAQRRLAFVYGYRAAEARGRP